MVLKLTLNYSMFLEENTNVVPSNLISNFLKGSIYNLEAGRLNNKSKKLMNAQSMSMNRENINKKERKNNKKRELKKRNKKAKRKEKRLKFLLNKGSS